jgi:hypothetical protein
LKRGRCPEADLHNSIIETTNEGDEMSKTITVDLPATVLNIEMIRNPFLGDMLCVTLANGRQVVIDAMQMTPEHECQVAVWDNFDAVQEGPNMVAWIGFNGYKKTDTVAKVCNAANALASVA